MIYWAYVSTYNLVGPYLLMGDFLKSKTSGLCDNACCDEPGELKWREMSKDLG